MFYSRTVEIFSHTLPSQSAFVLGAVAKGVYFGICPALCLGQKKYGYDEPTNIINKVGMVEPTETDPVP